MQLLKSALKFRNCTVPRHNSSVTIPFLSHLSFPSQVSSFLSHIIQQFKPILVPFHLPSKTPRECAPSSLGSILRNHFDWEKKLAEIPIEQLPCKCKQFERQHPNVDMVDGHVATGLENMSFQDPVLRELAYANSKSLVFPSKAKYAKQASVAFKKWCKTHFVPLETLSSWTQFIHQQWDTHLRHLRHRLKFHETHVLKMKDVICSDWVLHLADHESTHLMVFCPKFYFQSCHRVWSDEKVFKPMSHVDTSCKAISVLACSFRHPPQVSMWGFNLDAKLPAGQIFLKWKKSFKSGRTVISYKNTALGPILRAAAICIDQMVNWVWPGSLSRSVPQIWSEIHALFAQCPAHLDLELLNDDLVGFFNSVPQVRILEAVDMLVRMYSNPPATPSSSSGGLARRYRPGRMLSHRAKASSR